VTTTPELDAEPSLGARLRDLAGFFALGRRGPIVLPPEACGVIVALLVECADWADLADDVTWTEA
jgi:hypothetical protein